jgi:hypothetical protein
VTGFAVDRALPILTTAVGPGRVALGILSQAMRTPTAIGLRETFEGMPAAVSAAAIPG